MSHTIGEHFFRREYSYLVATLSRKVGIQHLQLVEDAVQSAFVKALERWQAETPEQPQAWLYRVAHNALIDEFRKRHALQELPQEKIETLLNENPPLSIEFESSDNLLHLLFICCDQTIPKPSRLVIALKLLCGFSVKEIALRLFLSEANVHKRYQRARDILTLNAKHHSNLDSGNAKARLDSVMCVLYLVFAEGYLSYSPDIALRSELCEEAIRLAELLVSTQVGKTPAVKALLALMYLNAARLKGRQNSDGKLLLLEEQPRDQWNTPMIYTGLAHLASSAEGEQISRYHLEAAIAAQHCRATSFATTDWQQICHYYEQLNMLFPAFQYRLNHAVALAQWKTPESGLALLDTEEPPTWFAHSYLWLTVKADLHLRAGHHTHAKTYSRLALECAPTPHIKALIRQRLKM